MNDEPSAEALAMKFVNNVKNKKKQKTTVNNS